MFQTSHIIALFVLVLGSNSCIAESNSSSGDSSEEASKPSAMLSFFALFIPVVIGVAALSILVRKVVLACKKGAPVLPTSVPAQESGLIKSLKTSDSIEDINFEAPEADRGFWIQLKKYTHVAKTETPTPGDEEAYIEEMPPRAIVATKSPKAMSPPFLRIPNLPELAMGQNAVRASVRV